MNYEQKRIKEVSVKILPRYCKYCGNEINYNTKICTGCGKKYFSFKRLLNNKICIILFILLCLSLAYNGYQMIMYERLVTYNHEESMNLNLRIDKLQKLNSSLNHKKDDLEEEIRYKDTILSVESGSYDDLQRYQCDFAYFTPSGTKYHKWGCGHIKNVDEIYCDNIYDLKDRGYTACKDCY